MMPMLDGQVYNLHDFLVYFDYPDLKKNKKTKILMDHLLSIERCLNSDVERYKAIIRISNPDNTWNKTPKDFGKTFIERIISLLKKNLVMLNTDNLNIKEGMIYLQ